MSTRYEPPADFHRQRSGAPATHFMHSAVAQDGKELWLLRVPSNVSLKDLEGLTIKHPKASSVLAETTLGAKSTTYQIISSETTMTEFAGMAEMNVLLPDDDDLTLLPNRCARLLAMVEKIVVPEDVPYAKQIAVRERPPRPQPDNMKLRFIPYGYYSAEEYTAMDNAASKPLPVVSDSIAEEPPRKKKKTKADTEEESKDKKKSKKKDKKKGIVNV
ncbi:hypothetical protein GGI20_004199 [Coemansia sp. BCRC 34301]|nr:hypothetical protein GGI20_004199 [Coemansia sp. BCRC 34301]